MKKLIITFICFATFFGSSMAIAQNNKDSKDYNSRSSVFGKKDFGLYLGLNTLDMPVDMPDMKTWESRYVALQWRKNHNLVTGRQVDIAMGTGIEVAWNNFMMQHSERYFETSAGTSDFETLDYPLAKSKLVSMNVNVPIMLQIGFKESGYRMGVGVFGGIKANSYQKFEDAEYGKYKEKGNYNLRNLNYGFVAEVGKKDFRIFAKYDALPLFNDNNPINGNVMEFGIRF